MFLLSVKLKMGVTQTIFLFFLLFYLSRLSLGYDNGTNDYNSTDINFMKRLSFGKQWYVYIRAYIFYIVHSEKLVATLNKQLTQINDFKISSYPCQNLKSSFGGETNTSGVESNLSETGFDFHTQSKLCGNIVSSYGLAVPAMSGYKPDIKNMTWHWRIYVQRQFVINVTILSLQCRFYPSCLITRALMKEPYDTNFAEMRIFGVFCPGNPPTSFYSARNIVEVHLHTSTLYQDLFLKNVYFNQWIGTVSYRYQIWDNHLSFDPWLSGRLAKGEGDYTYRSLLTYNVMSRAFAVEKGKTFLLLLTKEMQTNITYLTAIPFLKTIFESKGDTMYVMHLQAYLGATYVVEEGYLACSKPRVTLAVYDGPMVDITWIDSLLVRLEVWHCGHHVGAKNDKAKLKSRIGDLTLLILVKKRNDPYELLLKIGHRKIEANPNFVRMELFILSNGERSITAAQHSTFFYSINISSVSHGFVNLVFERLFITGYMDQACTYGGLYIVNYYTQLGSRLVGGVCSPQTASQYKQIYDRRGVTLSDRVIIYIKQYKMLTVVLAKMRFSTDECFGFVNLLQVYAPLYGRYYQDERKQVVIVKDSQFYGHGINFYYRWDTEPTSHLGIKRRRRNKCFKLQYVNFDNMHQDDVTEISSESKTTFNIGQFENIQPSLMLVSFWNLDDKVKYFDSCFAEALRFFADNQNNEPYVFLRSPEEEPWSTNAFNAKVGLQRACLAFGGAFDIYVQKIHSSFHCFSEVGGYLYDKEHPIIPHGVCSRTLVNFYHQDKDRHNRISFQSPAGRVRCCYINILVQSNIIPCISQVYAYRNLNHRTNEYLVHVWSNQGSISDIFTWRALCEHNYSYDTESYYSVLETCIDMAFYERTTCDLTIFHSMSLLNLPSNDSMIPNDPAKYGICQGEKCYVSLFFGLRSWNDAQSECETMNGSLVSVNSDSEWRLIVGHNELLAAITEMIYIGHRTVSNNL